MARQAGKPAPRKASSTSAARRASVAGTAQESWSDAWTRWNQPKSAAAYAAESRKSRLAKNLGARDLTVLGVSAIIGAGIFALPGVGVAIAGPAVVLGFVIAAIASGFAALNYAELATMMPISGSAYAYTYASLGELLAWLVGWNLVLEYALGNVAVAVAWGGFFDSMLRGVGILLPQALVNAPGTAPGAVFNLPAFLVVLAIMMVLVKGVKESARMATVIVGVKLFVLLFIIFFGAFFINPENFDPFAPFGVFGILGSAAIVFFAYIGFDAVSTTAEETRNPGRDLPIGIIGSLVISTALYVLVMLVLTGITPWQNFANSPDAAADAFRSAGLTSASVLIAVGAIVGITGVLLVFQLGMPRIFMSMARDGLLPAKFAEVHPKYKTPYFTTIFGSIIIATLAGLTPIAAAAELVNIGTLFAFLIVSIAVIILRKRMPDAKRPFKVPFAPWVPLLGIAFILALMLSLQMVTLIRFFAWSGVGLIIYGFYGGRHSRMGGGGGDRSVVLDDDVGSLGRKIAAPKARPKARADPFGDVHPVVEVEGIGGTYEARLKELGIEDTRQLWRASPARVAKATGAPLAQVRQWQQMAELMAVKGIGKQYAELLVRAGVRSIADLRKAEAAALAERVQAEEAGRGVRIQGNPVGPGLTENWIQAAKAHRPARAA